MFGSTPAGFAVAAHPAFLLAASNDPGGHGDDFGKSSPVGLLLLVLFLIATAFLVRSMNKHLKKVPASFDEPENGSGDDGPAEHGSGSAADGPEEPAGGAGENGAGKNTGGSTGKGSGNSTARKSQPGTSDGAAASN